MFVEVVVYVSGEAQWIAKGEFSKENIFENIDNTVELFKAQFEHENDGELLLKCFIN